MVSGYESVQGQTKAARCEWSGANGRQVAWVGQRGGPSVLTEAALVDELHPYGRTGWLVQLRDWISFVETPAREFEVARRTQPGISRFASLTPAAWRRK
jgi:hypothetical protein